MSEMSELTNTNENYRDIASRIKIFRENYSVSEWGIVTEVEPLDEHRKCFKSICKIFYRDRLISQASAERFWTADCIYPREFAETASVGRALAFLGIGSDALQDPIIQNVQKQKDKSDNVKNLNEFKEKQKVIKPESVPSNPSKEIIDIFKYIGFNYPKDLNYYYDKNNNCILVNSKATDTIKYRNKLFEIGFEICNESKKFKLDLNKIKKQIEEQRKQQVK